MLKSRPMRISILFVSALALCQSAHAQTSRLSRTEIPIQRSNGYAGFLGPRGSPHRLLQCAECGATRRGRSRRSVRGRYALQCSASCQRAERLRQGEFETGRKQAHVGETGPPFSYFGVKDHDWNADPGDFDILVGSSSAKIELQGKFRLIGERQKR